MSRTGICGSLFKKAMATGLVLVVFLAGFSPTAAAKTPGWLDKWANWSRVQTVPLETKIDVLLYKGEAPPSSLKIKGSFHSATTDTITLTLKDGQTRTLQKAAVHKVRIRRPFKKRTPGWLALGVSMAVVQGIPRLIAGPSDPNEDVERFIAWFHLIIVAPATAIAFFNSGMKPIYKVPPKHRKQLPATS